MSTPPYTHADDTLRALARQAEGFGRKTIGGLRGSVYHVTTLADDGAGSLREGCRRKEPLWIVFDVSGTIKLTSTLMVSSFKTIDGRGQNIKITDKGLRLEESEHVIICNLQFEGGYGKDTDAIQMKSKSTNVWIDRCSLRSYADGLIDISHESTNVTISRCYFSTQDKTMLIGRSPDDVSDRSIAVTIHRCFFDGTNQRLPRVRFGKVHLYNNYTKHWGIYAVTASVEAQIVSQNNIYEAGKKKVAFEYKYEKARDKKELASGWIRSGGDLFLNGAKPDLKQGPEVDTVFKPQNYYKNWTLQPASSALKEAIESSAGWQNISLPSDSSV